MFKGIAKQKRELTFAGVTLFLVVFFVVVTIWSLRFLVMQLGSALEEPKVAPSDILKFDLEGFKKLGLKE